MPISFEHAKRLKELGIKESSKFVYNYKDNNDYQLKWFPYHYNDWEYCHAYTSDELMDLLPACIDTKVNEPFNRFYFNLQKRSTLNIQYIINYHCDSYGPPDYLSSYLFPHNIHDENLADCLAKVVIYLIENKLMEIK